MPVGSGPGLGSATEEPPALPRTPPADSEQDAELAGTDVCSLTDSEHLYDDGSVEVDMDLVDGGSPLAETAGLGSGADDFLPFSRSVSPEAEPPEEEAFLADLENGGSEKEVPDARALMTDVGGLEQELLPGLHDAEEPPPAQGGTWQETVSGVGTPDPVPRSLHAAVAPGSGCTAAAAAAERPAVAEEPEACTGPTDRSSRVPNRQLRWQQGATHAHGGAAERQAVESGAEFERPGPDRGVSAHVPIGGASASGQGAHEAFRDASCGALLRQRRLCLVLDLDHTLVNSAKLSEVDTEHTEVCQGSALFITSQTSTCTL
jgi:hypothetical protein